MPEMFARHRAAVALVLVSLAAPPASAAEHLEQFSAVAVNPRGARATGRLVLDVLEITIDRWSSVDERDGLINLFMMKGRRELMKELSKSKPAGALRMPNGVQYQLRFARHAPGPAEGRRIVVGVDRRIEFGTGTRQASTNDDGFTVFELRVNKENVGDGWCFVLARITDLLRLVGVDVENERDASVRLIEVRPMRAGPS